MSPRLVFRVENLGPISHGEVELRPLTLLIGKNNTGKTYMAQAIHAAHKATERTRPETTHLLDLADLAAVEAIVLSDQPPANWLLPPEVLSKAQYWITHRFQTASRLLSTQLLAYHRIHNLDELSSWNGEGQSKVSISLRSDRQPLHIFGTSEREAEIDITVFPLDPKAARFFRLSLQHAILGTDRPQQHLFGTSDDQQSADRARRSASWRISQRLWRTTLNGLGFGSESYYMPAGRSGLLLACTEILRVKLKLDLDGFAVEEHLEEDPDRSSGGNSLSGAALGFLQDFQRLIRSAHRFQRRRQHQESPFPRVLELLEAAIGGSVEIDSEAYDIPAIVYNHGTNRIPVERASSMVTELGPFALWVKHLVAPGDLLIVDEPEAHLHPEAIRLVARALVRLANAGVKVLCATHSSVLIHQVSNCMLAATVPDKDVGLRPEDRISLSNLGVFLFKRASSESGVQVTSVKIDPVWGIPEEEYIEIADGLIDQAARIVRATQT